MANVYDKLKQTLVDAAMKKQDAAAEKGFTKVSTPAGGLRAIEKEDNTKRRSTIDKQLEDAEK